MIKEQRIRKEHFRVVREEIPKKQNCDQEKA